VDTSGHARTEVVLEAARHCELFLFDLKLMDSSAHRRYTGVGNERILHNLEQLSRAGYELWIRIPLVPGVNDDPSNLDATAEFLLALPRRHPVHLLPYHPLGRDKSARIARLDGFVATPTGSTLSPEDAAQRLARAGLEVHLGG
jgi:pyruvate formate lyase activating enzyme